MVRATLAAFIFHVHITDSALAHVFNLLVDVILFHLHVDSFCNSQCAGGSHLRGACTPSQHHQEEMVAQQTGLLDLPLLGELRKDATKTSDMQQKVPYIHSESCFDIHSNL